MVVEKTKSVVDWVRQEEPEGCYIAALAMVTGKSYWEVRSQITEFKAMGLLLAEGDQYLVDNGFAVARKYKWVMYTNSKRDIWPPEPWADVHLCFVRPTKQIAEGHCIVLLGDGCVLDPAIPEPRRLTDYYSVHNVTGVTRINNEQSVRELSNQQ